MSFSWNLSYPYNTPQRGLGTYDANGNLIPPTRAEWDAKVPFAKAGKPVAVLHRNGKPIITEPLIGVTLRDVVKSIERGLTRVLDPSDPDQRPLVYAAVANWLRGPVRRQLIEKYEARKLTARDLLGNYDGFEGNWSSQDGVLTYAVGS